MMNQAILSLLLVLAATAGGIWLAIVLIKRFLIKNKSESGMYRKETIHEKLSIDNTWNCIRRPNHNGVHVRLL